MTRSAEFDEATLFTVGTVGQPGNRLFLLQGGDGLDTLTLKMEKTQVIALSRGLVTALADLSRPHELPGEAPINTDLDPEWVAGSIEIAIDADAETIAVLIKELSEEEPAHARFVITKEQAAQFAIVATRLVEQGRPPCPLCGYPLDPAEHSCPRTNGHRAPSL